MPLMPRREPVPEPRVDPYALPPPAYSVEAQGQTGNTQRGLVDSPASSTSQGAHPPAGFSLPYQAPTSSQQQNFEHRFSVGSNNFSAPTSTPPQAERQPPTVIPPAQANLQRRGTQEDKLAILKRFDTVFLIDDSASMAGNNRWSEAQAALKGVAEQVVKYDSDGIDIHFLCSPHSRINVRSGAEVEDIFQTVYPVGESTPTEVRVEEILGPYVDSCESAKKRSLPVPRPMNLIVLTDGAADDPDTLAYTIAGYGQRLEENRLPLTQLGIQFIQIGDDPEASEGLRELDDDLKSNYNSGRDLVDTTPFQGGAITSDFLIKAALGGINRRVDRAGGNIQ